MEKLHKTLLTALLLLSCTIALAQNQFTAKGTIVDNIGEPIIGATVMEKGTANGAITDLDGNFTLKVSKEGAEIEVTYVGFITQVLPAKAGMNIAMKEDTQSLDELVVVGYQVQRKADLTGAVGVMDMKSPMSESNPDLLSSMQGRLAGVDIVTDAAPGSEASNIRVRGMSTINASNPLYVIDGIATTSPLTSLNAMDIESIQVLKDASSASIYGSRAANGVIIITTKKGKEGKMAINVNYNVSLQTVADSYDMMNTEQWGRAYWQALANDRSAANGATAVYGNGTVPVVAPTVQGTLNRYQVANTDWQKELYGSAWTHNLSASISNANEKGSYMLSANYINQKGLMENTYYRRITTRFNSTYNFNKYVRVGENLMIANWRNNSVDANTGDGDISFLALSQHPALPLYADGNDMLHSDTPNPAVALRNRGDNQDKHWRIFGNAYVEIMPIKGLTLKSNLGVEHVQGFSKTLTRMTRVTDATTTRSVSRGYLESDTYTWTNTANYNFDIKKDHHFNALLGTEFTDYDEEGLNGWNNDYAFEDAGYMQIGAGAGTPTVGGGKQEWTLFSIFGKFDYNYADRYLFSATLRRDQTSRLSSSNNTGVFPAFSGAWRVSEEKFWPKNKYVNNVKVRLAWGQNGNSAIANNYAAYSTYVYDIGNSSYDLNATGNNTVTGIKIASTGNPDLKWETTTQTNIGIDAFLFNDAVSLSLDYYWKNTKDMITQPPTLKVAGENATMNVNTGEMKNHGFEMNLGYRSPKYGHFSWDGNLNFSMYRNELTRLNSGQPYIINSFEQSGGSMLMEGQPMGVYYGLVCDGIFKDQEQVRNHATQSGAAPGRLIFRDIDGNGVINDNDRCIIGDPNPDFSMGINLSANYKNWTLSTFFSGEFGFDIYNSMKKQLDFFGYGNTYTNHSSATLNAWRPDNTGASIPALSTNDEASEVRASSYYVEDGSYLKCKYIKLSYNFSAPWMKTCGISALNLYGQVENVFTITDYSGLDPEVPVMGGLYGARRDNAPYPRARTFSVGLNLQF